MQKAMTLMFVSPFVLLAGLLPPSPQDSPKASPQDQAERQTESQTEPQTEPRAELLVLEAKEYSVAALVDLSAKFLGRNYLYQPNSSQTAPESQMVRLQNRLQLSRDNCEEVIGQLISIHGWALSPLDARSKIYKWMQVGPSYFDSEGPGSTWLSPEEILAQPNRTIRVTTSLILRYLNTERTANDMRSLFGNWGTKVIALTNYSHVNGLRTNGTGGTIVLTGRCQTIARIITMLRAADQERVRSKESLGSQIQTLREQLRRQEERLQALEKASKGK